MDHKQRVAVLLAASRYIRGGVDALILTGNRDRVESWLSGFGVKNPDEILHLQAMPEGGCLDLKALFQGVMDELRIPRDERDLFPATLPEDWAEAVAAGVPMAELHLERKA